ncbi:putative quinol monooxygenase [Streptococcus oriscaviae]|uniref:Antibiotic biosynthesis monooxygenase n=1 Tax=Streptococcus oriscaviae TaxID=2781599 RepID=A0ABX7YPH3_9STRE|nr:putative quinol monooxygenase [Streptococcus oriscaviae]QUE55174.1 antibiotic biosynthesis monooxygenase [Streptococcus oriscaviae]
MITMQLYYTGTNGSALLFVKEMEETGIAEKIRQEPGNLVYHYYHSLSDPETVLLVDAWADQEALDFHHASPMMQDILNLREKYGLVVRAERYRSDQENIPERDQQYHSH